jgi:uncharacterized membrane protein
LSSTPTYRADTQPQHPAEQPRSLALPGIFLGIGFGGFVDGILLHQLLQWHHMLTSTNTDRVGIPYYPRDSVHGLEVNTLWDGIFHVFTWLMILVGMSMLFTRVQRGRGQVWKRRALWSWMLVGWGMFNIVEGLVDHQVLGIHHVRSGEHQFAWDMGFLALGALLVLCGWLLSRAIAHPDPDLGPAPDTVAGPPTDPSGTRTTR